MDKIVINPFEISVVDNDTSEVKFYLTGKRYPDNPFQSSEKSITEPDQSFTIPQLLQRFANGQSLCVKQHSDYDDDDIDEDELLNSESIVLDDDPTDVLKVEAELQAANSRIETRQAQQRSEAEAASAKKRKEAEEAENAEKSKTNQV